MLYLEKLRCKCFIGYIGLVVVLLGKCSVGCLMMMIGNICLGFGFYLVLEFLFVRVFVWYVLVMFSSRLVLAFWGVWIFGMWLCVDFIFEGGSRWIFMEFE